MTRRFDKTSFQRGAHPVYSDLDRLERQVRARQVFVAGGMPTVTYVDRVALGLEKRLRGEIREGYKIVTVTGPTQSGKTVLTRHVLGTRKLVLVNGGHVGGSADFWTLLLRELEGPEFDGIADRTGFRGDFRQMTSGPAGPGNGSVPAPGSGCNKTSILKYMRHNDIALVVDDFHHLPSEVQIEIGRSLKSEVFEGLTAILIAVPRRTFDAIGMEREMEGRFAHIEIPPWAAAELMEIPAKGFPILNMDVGAGIVRRFAAEAQGNPLLVQRFCGRLCDHFDVDERLPSGQSFRPTDAELNGIFQAVGTQFRFSDFRKAHMRPPIALNMD